MALISAAAKGSATRALELIRAGADVKYAEPSRGDTALFLACGWPSGMDEVVHELIAHGADVNARCIGGSGPLHSACATGSPKLIESLLANGARVDAVDDKGLTPLHVAAMAFPFRRPGDAEASIGVLLAHHPDVNAKDKEGRTPLDMAVKDGQANIAAMLIRKGARSGAAERGK